MKTIAQSLLTILLLSMAAFASNAPASTRSANPTVTTNSYKVAVFPASVSASKLHVIVEREPGQAMSIYLKDAQGMPLAQQRVSKKQGTFRFQFDLSAVKDGNYSVEVVSGSDVVLYPVTLKSQLAQASTRTITVN